MPKCILHEEATKHVRGVAGAEGWTFVEVYGPGGNKFAVFCPKTTLKEMQETVATLLATTQKD